MNKYNTKDLHSIMKKMDGWEKKVNVALIGSNYMGYKEHMLRMKDSSCIHEKYVRDYRIF